MLNSPIIPYTTTPVLGYSQSLMPSPALLPPTPLRSRRLPANNYTTILTIPMTEVPITTTHTGTPRRCSPYISPSNPFSRAFASAPAGASPQIEPRLVRAFQGFLNPSEKATGEKGWKVVDTPQISNGLVESAMKVVFWAAVVIFFSALAGVGGSGGSVELNDRVWSQHVDMSNAGVGGLGWKGLEMSHAWDIAAWRGEANGLLEGIWDQERVERV